MVLLAFHFVSKINGVLYNQEDINDVCFKINGLLYNQEDINDVLPISPLYK